MKSFFKDTFHYTFHYNNEVITSFLEDNKRIVSEKLLQLLNHTINAHEIWNARIMGEKPDIGVWGIRPTASLSEQNKINYENSLKIVDTFDLERIIQYTNSKGQPFENSVKDILFHVINHSTYHRGQIASYYKQKGGIPLISDYIFYKR